MKTLKETLELSNELVMRSTKDRDTYFMDFSGHVNRLDVSVYRLGFDRRDILDKESIYNGYLNTDIEIQLAYFSILKEMNK
tara:strand:- start:387 stop:629 length:243 start_codon:yes stop_codon:yes gene_type:complete